MTGPGPAGPGSESAAARWRRVCKTITRTLARAIATAAVSSWPAGWAAAGAGPCLGFLA